jgi:catechol 2,3-dioxygenase
LFLAAGGYHHHLGTNSWAQGAPSASEDDARLLDWELVLPAVSDVAAATASLQAQGFEVVDAAAADPWGTRVRLVPETTSAA